MLLVRPVGAADHMLQLRGRAPRQVCTLQSGSLLHLTTAKVRLVHWGSEPLRLRRSVGQCAVWSLCPPHPHCVTVPVQGN